MKTYIFVLLIFPMSLAAQQRTVVYNSGINNIWVVPAGVTSVTIEAWGGGGGGSNKTGGQGGGYFKVQFQILPGSQIASAIGNGGLGGSTIAGDGTSTEVTYTQTDGRRIQFVAGGGQGGNNTASGVRGDYSYTSQNTNWQLYWVGFVGSFGSVTQTIAIAKIDAASYLWSEKGGDGGTAGNRANTNGWGGSSTCIMRQGTTGFSVLSNSFFKPAIPGVQPGGGGGAMPNLNPSTSMQATGAPGAGGLVIITY